MIRLFRQFQHEFEIGYSINKKLKISRLPLETICFDKFKAKGTLVLNDFNASRSSALLPGESRRVNLIVSPLFSPAEPRSSNAQEAGASPLSSAFTQIVAVEERCPAGARYVNETDGLMLFLTTRGKAQWEVGTRCGLHQPGTLVGIVGQQGLIEQVAQDGDWAVIYFLLKGAWADGIESRWNRPESGGVWGEPVSPRLREVFEAMVALLFAQTAGWEWNFLSHCAELFGGLCQRDEADGAEISLSQRLRTLLLEAPTARPTPAEIANLVGLTPRQLLYRIRQETGEPLATWTRKRRIEQAGQLLQAGRSVSEVSECLGFANPYHFSRQFRSVMGVTPSTYRANFGAGKFPLRRHSDET